MKFPWPTTASGMKVDALEPLEDLSAGLLGTEPRLLMKLVSFLPNLVFLILPECVSFHPTSTRCISRAASFKSPSSSELSSHCLDPNHSCSVGHSQRSEPGHQSCQSECCGLSCVPHTPKDMLKSTPCTCEYALIWGKKVFADGIKLKLFT